MSNIPRKCGTCGQKAVLPATIDYAAKRSIGGVVYAATVHDLSVRKCSNCNEIWLDSDADTIICRTVMNVAGLLMPEEVRAIREELGLSIQAMAQYLQMEEDMLERIEQGYQIQTKAEDDQFRLLEKPEYGIIAGEIINGYGDDQPSSLMRLVRSYEVSSRFERGVAGGDENDFIAATVIGGKDAIRLPSVRFASWGDAFLSGFGPGHVPIRDGVVRFEGGEVIVNAIDFPYDERWGLYCLSSDEDPASSDHLEVFALRWGSPPEAIANPFDFVETGHIAAARQKAELNGWAGSRMDGLRCVSAIRMELLIDEAVADMKSGEWFLKEHSYLVESLENSGKRIVSGIVQAIGARLREGVHH